MEPPAQMSDYQIQGELGRGSYGVVYRVLNTRDNQLYVLKKINISHLSAKHQNDAFKEIQILRQLNHPHIIKYYASFVEDCNVNIIMEFAEGGDLHRLLKMQREKQKHFSEKEVWRYAFELSTAIAYLHEHSIIHRDIKCMNVFLSKDKRVKLGDLGASKITGAAAMLQTRVGTPLYLAPELVRQSPYDNKVDVWALGCVLYMLTALEAPFQGDNLIALGSAIVNKKPKAIPAAYTPKLSAFIMRLLEKRPKDRPSIAETIVLIPSNTRLKLESVASIEDLATNFTLAREEPAVLELPPLEKVSVERAEKSPTRAQSPHKAEARDPSQRTEVVSIRSETKRQCSSKAEVPSADLSVHCVFSQEKATKPPPAPKDCEVGSFGAKAILPYGDPTPVLKEDVTVHDEPVPEPPKAVQKRPQTASAARFSTPRKQTRMRVTVRNLLETTEQKQITSPLSAFPPPLPPSKLNESITEPKIVPRIEIIEAKAPLIEVGRGQKVSEDDRIRLRRIFDTKRPSTAVVRVRPEEKKPEDELSDVSAAKLTPAKPSARPMSAIPKAGKLNPLFKPPRLQSLLHPSACAFLGTHVQTTHSAKKKFSVSDLNSS